MDQWGIPKKWLVYNMETPIKMDDDERGYAPHDLGDLLVVPSGIFSQSYSTWSSVDEPSFTWIFFFHSYLSLPEILTWSTVEFMVDIY